MWVYRTSPSVSIKLTFKSLSEILSKKFDIGLIKIFTLNNMICNNNSVKAFNIVNLTYGW